MARYYDAIYTTFVDYPALTRRLEKIFAKHLRRRPKSILDIACGTGNYTFTFAKRGYQTTGIDLSDDMLEVAIAKGRGKTNPQFFKMDMREIKLKSKFDVATVLFGGFGYLHQDADVDRFLAGTFKQMNRNGLLAFEFWQNSAIRPAATRPNGERSWENLEDHGRTIIRLNSSKYDAQTNLHNTTFELYVLDRKRNRLLDNFSETHVVKTYTISQIRDILTRNKFKPLTFYDGDLAQSAEEDQPSIASFSTFRVLAVARPSG